MTMNNPKSTTNQGEFPENQPLLPSGNEMQELPEQQDLTPEQRRTMIVIIIIVIFGISMIIGSIFWLANQPPVKVALIRDIFIIWMAIMSLLISLALVILMIQMARLINLMQNEIKPILDSTNETVSYLRGTTVFLGDNLAEPVIKANEYFAGIGQFFSTLGLIRKSTRKNQSKKTKESE
jgi:hypothetical protein